MFEGVHGTHGKFKVIMGYQRGLVGLRKIYYGMFRGRVKGGEGSGRNKHGKLERRRQSRGRSCVSRASQYAYAWDGDPGVSRCSWLGSSAQAERTPRPWRLLESVASVTSLRQEIERPV